VIRSVRHWCAAAAFILVGSSCLRGAPGTGGEVTPSADSPPITLSPAEDGRHPASPKPGDVLEENTTVKAARLSPEGSNRALALAHFAEALRLESQGAPAPRVIEHYRKVVEVDPHFIRGHIKIVGTMLNENVPLKALDYLKLAKESNPDSAELEAAVSFAHRLLGEDDKALEIAKEVLKRDPEINMAYRVILEIYSERGKSDDVVAVVEKAAGGKSKNPEFWMNFGRLYSEALIRENRYGNKEIAERLLPVYARAREHGATEEGVFLQMANCHLMLGNLNEGVAVLKEAAKVHDASPEIYLRLASFHVKAKELDKALDAYEEAFKLAPDYAGLAENLSQIYQQKGDLAKAAEVLEGLKQRSPANTAVYLELARIYKELDRKDDRLRVLREAARMSPDRRDVLETLVQAYEELGDRLGAISVLEKAIRRAPTHGGLYVAVARMYEGQGQFDKAISNYQQALTLAPAVPDVHLQLALVYIGQNRFDDAAKTLAEARSQFPNSARAAFLDAINARYQGNSERALEILDETRMLAVGREHTIVSDGFFLEMALNHELAGRPGQSETILAKAIVDYPEAPELRYHLARTQMANKDDVAAAKTLREARQKFPDSTRFPFLQAVRARELKDYKSSLQYLDEIRKLSENQKTELSESFYLELGLTQELAGDIATSERTLREGLDKMPNSHLLQNALAYLWAEQSKNLEEALALSQKSLEADPDNGAYLDTLGWIYFKLGNYREALPVLERAAVASKNDPVVEQHLGETHAKLGDTAKALEVWKAILVSKPEDSDVVKDVKDLIEKIEKPAP
jgi:tetratricopeptide (TPR) repeat protein